MACRIEPRRSFVERLALISPHLRLEWNHKEIGFDLYEMTYRNGRRKQWVMFVHPWMQDLRTLTTLRRNDVHNRRTYLAAREHQERARELHRLSGINSTRDMAGQMAEDVGKACGRPTAGQDGVQTLKDMTSEWDRTADEHSTESD